MFDLARNGHETYCRNTVDCMRWGFVSMLAVESIAFTKMVSKSSLVYLFDVGLFGSKEMLCLLLLQGVVGSWICYTLTIGPYTVL